MSHVESRLKSQFEKNLLLFKQKLPEVYEKIQGTRINNFNLVVDGEGAVHLEDAAKNRIYPCKPVTFCQEQVEKYFNKPLVTDNKYEQAFVRNPNHKFIRNFNALIDDSAPYLTNESICSMEVIGVMLHANVGLGYQLEMLIKRCEIYNLILIEQSAELFLMSFFTIDWSPIISFFEREGRALHIFIDTNHTEINMRIRLFRETIGLHNMANTFIYTHLATPGSESFFRSYISQTYMNFYGVGFFDDEQTGLAHTIVNLDKKHRFFYYSPTYDNKQVAIVIGNGPSLDSHIDFLKDCKDKVVIFSCGTALSSLAKEGIKPDFHIETERNKHLTDWISQGTSEDFRRGICLLCLNTVSPEVVSLFDEVCVAKKVKDVGETVIDKFFDGFTLPALSMCNPTVSNAGVSFALNMGFKNIYLVGVDLGMKEDGYHHSKLSIYRDIELKAKRKDNCSLEKANKNYRQEGNFGGEVLTNSTLHNSAQIMTNCIGLHRQKFGKIHAYNLNDGIKIHGFEPRTIKRNERIYNHHMPAAGPGCGWQDRLLAKL